MLQQILQDMFIDPELLAELDEEQKQTLFCKMREEQIRRWKIREEKLEEEEKKRPPVSKPNRPKIGFLMGSDGKPWTWVMGEHQRDVTIEQILEAEAQEKAQKLAEDEAEEQAAELRKKLNEAELLLIQEQLNVQQISEQVKNVEQHKSQKDESLQNTNIERVQNNAANDKKEKRSSEIFLMFQIARQKSYEQAEKDGKQIDEAWQAQEKKSKQADEEKRYIAKRCREDYTRSLRKLKTESQIIGAFKMGLQSSENSSKPIPGSKGTPTGRPARPSTQEEVIQWYKEVEEKRGAGIDPKTKEPADYFHGMINRQEAEDRLQGQPAGTFLIRLSDKVWGYALSHKGSDHCKHYLIDASSGVYQFFGTNQIQHKSLADFVNHHMYKPISILENELLKYPLAKKETTQF